MRTFLARHVPTTNGGSPPERVVVDGRQPKQRGEWFLTPVDRSLRTELRQQLILELVRGSNISQRALARRLGIALGTVNRLLHGLVESGYIRVFNPGVRPFAYEVTLDGRRYLRRLGLEHYARVLSTMQRLEQRIRGTLRDLRSRGVRRVVFYGAGEIMEATYRVAVDVGLEVIGVVDDDTAKVGSRNAGLTVEPPRAINQLRPDAVLITTFRHAEEIQPTIDASLRSSVEVQELWTP